jgi:hypothetical protein
MVNDRLSHDFSICWRTCQKAVRCIPMLVVRRVISCLLGLLPVLLIAGGIRIFTMAVQARDPAMYSIRDNYIGDALLFSSIGLVGLFGCHRLWQAGTRRTWALVPIATVFFAVLFPLFQYGHHGTLLDRSYRSTTLHLGSVAHQLMEAAKENGRFVCASFSDPFNSKSMFFQQGQALPYVVQCVANATGPATGAPPERPGTIVVATSPDQKQAWFTATVLPIKISRRATWLERDGQPLVIAMELKPNPYRFTVVPGGRVHVKVQFESAAEMEVEVSDLHAGQRLWKSNNYIDESRIYEMHNGSAEPMSLSLSVRHKGGKPSGRLAWRDSDVRIRELSPHYTVMEYEDEGLDQPTIGADGDWNDAVVEVKINAAHPIHSSS